MRRSQALALLALAAPGAGAKRSSPAGHPFTTALTGLGGSPIGLTPVGTPDTSTLSMVSLASTDPDAQCNGAAGGSSSGGGRRVVWLRGVASHITLSPRSSRCFHASDGSAAAYFYAPSTAPAGSVNASTWLVYLEGSMFCWNGESCQDRAKTRPYWASSTVWAPVMAQGGIFATDPAKSAFATAHRIYVKYCSSDLWSGDLPASATSPASLTFRGARIVAAVITSLVADQGMGSVPGSQLLFGGCSAGAIGAMNNLDAVAAQVPPTVRVRGLLDASALVDIAPTGWGWSPDLVPLQTLVAELVAAVAPTFDDTCLARYSGSNAWMCLWGQYRMPLLATPFFANAVQFDDFEIQYDTDNLAPHTPAQLAFVDSFQPAFLALIRSLPPGTGVFSPTCLVHCLSGQPTFQSLLVNGVSMSGAVAAWWAGQPAAVVSGCTGWDCTAACGVTRQGLPCNMGAAGCTAITMPTETSDEPAPAGAPQPGQAAEAVATTEGSLTGAQQAGLSALVAQQQASRRVLAAADRCCGH